MKLRTPQEESATRPGGGPPTADDRQPGAPSSHPTHSIQVPHNLSGDAMTNTPRLNISDKSNTLLEPNLHDGRLLGINLLSKDCVELSVAEVGGKRYRIFLDGISQFHATDFREGNIISDVTVTPSSSVQISDLQLLGHIGQNAQRLEEDLKKIHDKMLRESLLLFEINPSYGCQLIGVAKSLRLESN
jgi:hypothetical protein